MAKLFFPDRLPPDKRPTARELAGKDAANPRACRHCGGLLTKRRLGVTTCAHCGAPRHG